MSSLLYRLGRRVYRAHRLVAVLWLLIVVAGGGGALLLNQGTDNTFSIPGTQSQTALDQLERTFPQVSGTSARYVVIAPEGGSVQDADVKGPVGDAVTALGDIDEVAAVTDPYSDSVSGTISEGGNALVITAQMDGSATTTSPESRDALKAEATTLQNALPAGSVVSLGGDLFAQNLPGVTITEAIGLVVALVVLVLTFGSFLAAGMPLVTALLGVALSMSAIFIATRFASISSTTPLLALMLGLAVGIDYALFIISRHQDQLKQGMEPEESTARATATAGSAVVFAGLTVIIALVGLSVAGIPFLTTMGIAAAGGVAIAVVIALTLTPALLGFAGARLRPRERRAKKKAAKAAAAAGTHVDTEEHTGSASAGGHAHAQVPRGFFRGWVRVVTRFPIVTIIAVIGVLGVASIPALSLRLALPDAGYQAEGTPARTTYDLLAENFGAGYNGPLIVTGTIIGSTDPLGLMNDLKGEIEKLDGVASVPLATPNETADTGIIQVIPEGGPDSETTKALVAEIRDKHDDFQREYGVDLAVTGQTAVGIDISDTLARALLPFGLLVVGLSLVLLTMVFRSLWVPIKATLGYLLSVGASFGAVAAVFEWGWFSDALHVDKTGPIISFMPIILMGVLFGLAMDYEVFLVSRMREDYVHGRPARAAVESGFVGSAKVVTAAAIIMFSVFAAFVPEGDTNIKPIALGLAVGVFVDAFIVRMTLVPAVLHLLGDRAWQMPRWLDRVLPSFDVEGEGLTKELALADWPEPGSTDVIAAEGLCLDGPNGPIYHDVSLRVAPGSSLVVHGPHRSGRTALLLSIAGRLAPDSGRLKVAGLVVPIRSAAVRGRVALVRLAGAADPVAEVRSALESAPPILVLDDLDTVTDPQLRDAIRAELDAARTVDGTFTVVASCVDAEALDDLLPSDRGVLAVFPAAKRRAIAKVL
ncbi:MMPL family transporter [Rathayibacter rathayi]|uniref:Transporter n=1 Tax=Rathayibacter rathayi TaxID=33887 RepID=A0ABX5AAH0_RATRA|nr:MMPL family transporter [Rathayibacter rathayi]AZZ49918.1 transporter [Rathayibacter rathayi]MWV75201.1 MMPL family transporter [Rathayibacter rathayi NCPPB 2980 = VKM Ac-1601]PPF48669.1 transporter [Rathayibacter rathayi]PPF79478.1 transporter [Rathayibacter rathayi]PPG13832.1 transporter [Rathayibacter rathayi]